MASRQESHLVGQLVGHSLDYRIIREYLLSHLVQCSLYAGAIVSRKDAQRSGTSGSKEVVKVKFNPCEAKGLCDG